MMQVAMIATVDVWRLPLSVTESQLSRIQRCLSPDELSAAGRFVFAQDRCRYVAARAGLRHILARYTGEEPHEVRFVYGRYGKPRLAGPGHEMALEFNLSHSGDWAVIAVAFGFPVGVDIEKIRPDFATAEMAAYAFSPNERAALAVVHEDCRAAAFFKCWTSKEAYIKGVGYGLALPLQEFDVCVRPDAPAKLLRTCSGVSDSGPWSLYDVDPGPGYSAALAAARTAARITKRTWCHKV